MKNGPTMRREKLQVVVSAAETAADGRYVPDQQVEITEVAIKVAAEITAATLTPLSADEQRMIGNLLRKLG
jgi:hypothetical protein